MVWCAASRPGEGRDEEKSESCERKNLNTGSVKNKYVRMKLDPIKVLEGNFNE